MPSIKLERALDRFRCYRDIDIERFLRFKAIEFEKRGYCTVYLILDTEAFTVGDVFVRAYFTLSHKAIIIGKEVSKNIRGKISTNRTSELAHLVLIGQLGKYLETDKADSERNVSSTDILNDAFDIIEKSSDIIICRGVLVECSGEEKIHNIYEKYGFSFLQIDKGYYQFYKKIYNKV